MKLGLITFLTLTAITLAPAHAGHFNFSGYSKITSSQTTTTTDSDGNTSTITKSSTVIYQDTPPVGTQSQTVNNSVGSGSSNNTQSVTQKQTLIILGHH